MGSFHRKKNGIPVLNIPLTRCLFVMMGVWISLYGAAYRHLRIRKEEVTESAAFVAFLRIPKTGSTSLWWFMNDYSRLENFRNYFGDMKLISPERLWWVSCIFGPKRHDTEESKTVDSDECSHLDYTDTREAWLEASASWAALEVERTKADHTRDTMQTFTMVRDPFDRLRSYFNYIYESVEDRYWETDETEAQYSRVLQGDFHGWMELIFAEQEVPHGPQYTFIHEDIDKAIELISGDSPEVIALINECFEASLRLLASKVSIPTEAVEDFLHSDDYRSNVSGEHQAAESANMQDLRERSRIYLANEYKFYDAAVEQFKRQLPSLDASLLREKCDLSSWADVGLTSPLEM